MLGTPRTIAGKVSTMLVKVGRQAGMSDGTLKQAAAVPGAGARSSI